MSRRSLEDTATAVRSGKDSARRQVEHSIRCHEASNLGAYICFDADGARTQADRIDAAVARGEDPGPLAGITVSVKDLYGVQGLPTRAGTQRELPKRWQQEGFLVRALRTLGAVIVGKTHTVELAFGGVGWNRNTGTPVNPWDSKEHRVPGGSSSGAGVSLWEGSARIALGTDTGGSVRIPASATGVVGHRQTTGRWPTTGVFPLSATLDTVGLLARTAADSLYAFRAIDRVARAARAARVGPATASLNGLRIGVPVRSYTWRDAQPDVAEVVRTALCELEARGAVLKEVEMPEWDQAGISYLSGKLVPPECIEFLERELPEWAEILDPAVGARLRDARDTLAIDYVRVLRLRHRLSELVHRQMDTEGLDVLATPTLPVTPPLVSDLEPLVRYRKLNRAMLSGTGPASMLDMCAVSVPAGLDHSGIPAGLQITGRSGRDLELLARATAIEAVLGTGVVRMGVPPRVAGSQASR